MIWHDLCFMHWPIPVEVLRPLIPQPLQVDTHDGVAYIALVPFRMSQVCPRGIPHWPWLTDFPEMNVRTYVRDGRDSGVWFFSLDATQRLAIWAARTFFHLPYFMADMRCEWHNSWFYYSCQRDDIRFAGRYRPTPGGPQLTKPGSLEYFLTERYWLFAQSSAGVLSKARIHHYPWPLEPAEVEIQHQSYLNRFDVLGHPKLVHFVREIGVDSWLLQPVDTIPN